MSAADLDVVKGIHDVAEDAETDAFNPAIAAASGDAATALQVSSFLLRSLINDREAWVGEGRC